MGANCYLSPAEREILERARIGIAGCGGLGSNCAMHLVRAGVRKFALCDFDVVNQSNLNRQFFFRDQLGRKKVEALADNLRRIEPKLDLEIHDLKLDGKTERTVFADCDVVVEALDDASAKAELLGAWLPTGRFMVAASGIAGWGRSGAIQVRRLGRNLVMVGDGTSGVGVALPPQSPRVGIVAAMEANAVVALLLGLEV